MSLYMLADRFVTRSIFEFIQQGSKAELDISCGWFPETQVSMSESEKLSGISTPSLVKE